MKLWKLLQSAMLLLAFTTMVSCVDDNDDMGAPSLEVSPTSLTFGEDGVAADGNVIIVVSNRVWSAEVQKGADWVTISQIEGEGDGKIEVSVPAGESAMATITIAISNPMGILMKEEVTIVRGKGTVTPPLEDAIFNETFGSMAVASPYPYIDQYTDFKMSGSGSEGVTYEGAGMSVRKAAKSNTGAYVYASGPNELFFGTTATAGTSFIVKAITLPEAKTDFLLTAGGTYYDYDSKDNTFNTENFIIELSGDGKSWSPITYTKSDGDTKEPFWTYLTANFTLKVASAKLYIKYTAMEKSKFRMDDVTLFEGNGGQEVDLAGGSVDPDPEPEPVDAIYNETFGTMTVASPYPLVGDYTDFTKSGSGAADVTYEGLGSISMRASGKSSAGAYAAASGPNVAFFGTFAEGATSSSFIVKNITLPADKKNFTLSWGGNYYNYDAKDNVFNPANFTAELSGDGTTWVPITYTKTNGDVTDPFWTYITSTFSLKAASAKLFVRYTATEESRFRMDDITLVESATAGTEVDLGGAPAPSEPTVTTVSAASLTMESAILGGSYADFAAGAVTAVGVQYKVGAATGIDWTGVAKMAATAVATPWTVDVTGLTASTKYTFRAYATTATGDVFGDAKEFTTDASMEDVVPEVPAGAIYLNFADGVDMATPAFSTAYVVADTEVAHTIGGLVYKFKSPGYKWFSNVYDGDGKGAKTMIIKSGSYILLPAIDGKTLKEVVVVTARGAAKSTEVFMTDEAGVVVVGGEDVNTPPNSINKMTLTGTAANTSYRLNSKTANFQLTKLVLVYTAGGVAPDPVPTISANPSSLSFVAAGASQDIACTVTNQGENVVAASSNNAHFTTLVSGTTVSVTAPANTTDAAISGVITLTLGSASTTVAVSQAAVGGGEGGDATTLTLDFSKGVDMATPAFITDYSKEGDHVIDGYTYKFRGAGTNVKEGFKFYNNAILIGKTGAYIEFPIVAGKTLSKVSIGLNTGGSIAVMVSVKGADDSAVAGGDALKFETDKVYTLTGTDAAKAYKLSIDSKHNAQFKSIILEYK